MKNFIYLASIILGLFSSYCVQSNSNNAGVIDRFYVGDDSACDFNTIQAGINAASNSQNSPELLVSDNKIYVENVFISIGTLLLDGSYSNCADAKNGIHGGNNAIINGFPGSQIATMQMSAPQIHIKNIQLTDNVGGGVFANATSVITLENMSFSQLGQLSSFGAIQTQGNGQVDLIIKNSTFTSNIARFGAAIFCYSNNHTVNVSDDSLFDNNIADADGGAIFIGVGCELSMSNSIIQNNSAEYCGGIYSFANTVSLNNVTFDSNRALEDGGAICADSNTFTMQAVQFINNQSVDGGGAIFAVESLLTIKANSDICSHHKCNLFNNNKSSLGGAIVASEGSVVNISSTYFENNRADFGTALILSSESLTNIEGSVFNNNGDNGSVVYQDNVVVYLIDNSKATITYSTFTDNKSLLSTFKQEDNTDLKVYSSIIYDDNSGNIFDIDPSSINDVNCLITHEDQSFDASNSFVTVVDPMFIDATNGDYHIDAALSPAVDYCTDTTAMAEYTDIDNQARGYDDPTAPNNPNTNGAYDIGADETYSNDIIFADGFEE